MRQVQAVNWKALKKTETITVDGVELTLKKRGVERILEDVAAVPLFGDLIELLLSPSMRKAFAGKPTTEMLKDAFLAAAEGAGLDAGKEMRKVVTALPRVFVDLFVQDTVLASEDEREDFREWLGTLGLAGVMDAFVGWASVNLPEIRDPLVRGAAWLLLEADKAMKSLTAGVAQLPQSLATAAAPAESPTPA